MAELWRGRRLLASAVPCVKSAPAALIHGPGACEAMRGKVAACVDTFPRAAICVRFWVLRVEGGCVGWSRPRIGVFVVIHIVVWVIQVICKRYATLNVWCRKVVASVHTYSVSLLQRGWLLISGSASLG